MSNVIIQTSSDGLTIIDGPRRAAGIGAHEITDDEAALLSAAVEVAQKVLERVSGARVVESRDPDVLAPMVADLQTENAKLKAQIADMSSDDAAAEATVADVKR